MKRYAHQSLFTIDVYVELDSKRYHLRTYGRHEGDAINHIMYRLGKILYPEELATSARLKIKERNPRIDFTLPKGWDWTALIEL